MDSKFEERNPLDALFELREQEVEFIFYNSNDPKYAFTSEGTVYEMVDIKSVFPEQKVQPSTYSYARQILQTLAAVVVRYLELKTSSCFLNKTSTNRDEIYGDEFPVCKNIMDKTGEAINNYNKDQVR